MHGRTTTIVLGFVSKGINTKKDISIHSGKSLEQVSSAVNTLVNRKKLIQGNDSNGYSEYELADHRIEKWFLDLPNNIEEAAKVKHRTDFDAYEKMIKAYNKGVCK